MEIRTLTKPDVEQYMNLRINDLKQNNDAFESSFEEEVESCMERMYQRLASEDELAFGAFEDEQLVGVVSLLLSQQSRLNHRARIIGLYVDHAYRNSGVNRMLVKKAVEEAKNNKAVEQLYINVVASNFVAKRLYKSLGFHTYAVDRNALKIDGKYYDEELMVLSFI